MARLRLAGAENLTLVDPAKLEEHQRERHVLSREDVGTHKVEGMETRLYGIARGKYLVQYAPFRPDMIYSESGKQEFRAEWSRHRS